MNPAIQSITVYSKPACVMCTSTYRALDKRDIEFTPIDVTADKEAYDYLVSLKILQMPMVEVRYLDGTSDRWTGFDPDKIQELVAA